MNFNRRERGKGNMQNKRKVYLICPVRFVTPVEAEEIRRHVGNLEADGDTVVHFPPRDVDQSNDNGGVRICEEHRKAMFESDEVHVWWNEQSSGSHFDLGMAYMLDYVREQKGLPPIRFLAANPVGPLSTKSFQNVLYKLHVDTVCATGRHEKKEEKLPKFSGPLATDSGEGFLDKLSTLSEQDWRGLHQAYLSYGPSWKSRGGVGAFMMLARKWDRLENRVRKCGWDLFRAIATDTRGEGVIDDVRDLRRYLLLVEGEMAARGFGRTHRDNA